LSNAFKNIRNIHVRERHENAQREVTFYQYTLEYIASNVVYNQRLGVQMVKDEYLPSLNQT
jgi:hypothetical protein